MRKYTIDRFEGDKAILLLRNDESIQIELLKEDLPTGVNEGDILSLQLNSSHRVVSAEILREDTLASRERVSKLIKKLQNKKLEE